MSQRAEQLVLIAPPRAESFERGNVSVGPALGPDLSSLACIEAAAPGGPGGRWDKQRIAQEAAKHNYITYIARVWGQTRVADAGWAIFQIRPDKDPCHDRILRLSVRPEYRRLGVGSALIAKLLQRTKERAAYDLPPSYTLIDVEEHNLDAQLFLRSCGFRCQKILVAGRYLDTRYRFTYGLEAAIATKGSQATR